MELLASPGFPNKDGLYRRFCNSVLKAYLFPTNRTWMFPCLKVVCHSLLIVLPYSANAKADQIAISAFGGLNNNESSAIIGDNEAQDILNCEISPGGRSVKKRSGYGLYKALGTGQAIHGGHHFYNSGGSDVQVWGSSTSLYGITSDATPVQIVSSATLNTTWDCADTQGHAYCVTSNRNLLLKTDGASITQWMTSPLGTMVTVTPDRLVVAGISGATNSLYFSQQNTFNNFTTGINETDPFIEVIAAPGAAITHITWGCQKLLWWKNSSFGYINGTDQFNLEVVTVNDSIGTVDNSSAIDPGGTVWFRGQDGHLYSYNCSALIKESIDITPLIQASGNRTANSWTQTTQSDFQAGISSPTGNLSFTMSPNSVVLSSYGVTESSTQWALGTVSNLTVGVSSLSITLNNSGTVTDSDFESTTWVQSGDNLIIRIGSVTNGSVTISPQSGGLIAGVDSHATTDQSLVVQIINSTTSAVLASKTHAVTGDGAWTQYNLFTGGVVSSDLLGKRVKIRIYLDFGGTASYFTQPTTFILGGNVTYYLASNYSGTGGIFGVDNIQLGRSTITGGVYTSQAYDTGFSTSICQLQASFTADSSTPSFSLRSSPDNATYTEIATSTGTSATSKRYLKFSSTITTGGSDDARTYFSSFALVCKTTGTFYSQVKNAPLVTAWDTFTANAQDTTHTFYVRSGTNTFSVTSATPTWVAQTAGALVAASTGTFFQVRDDISIVASTQSPTINDFTINWFEGNASDKCYIQYFDNAIWNSVAYGAGQASNNYIFKYDLINKTWLLYNIGTGGMLQQGQYLYFGSTVTHNTFKYGSGTSDNGTAIEAYYRSKDFMGADPWLENQYKQLDTYYKANQNQNLTVSYFLNTSTTSTSYAVNLSTNTQSVIRNKKLLPNGKIGGNINIKFGDTSDSSAWELLGYRFLYDVLSYRPTQ